MILLSSTATPAVPDIDLSLGSFPIYILLIIFAWAGVLFVRRSLKGRMPRQHIPSLVVSLAALVCAVLYGIFLGGLHVFTGAFSWTFLVAALLFSFLVQTFKRSFGTISGLVFAAFIIAIILFIRSLTAFTGRTLIARIHADLADGTQMTLLVEPQPGAIPTADRPFTITLPGERFGLIVYQIVFDDAAVFLGAKTRFAWLGMMSFGSNFIQKKVHFFSDGLSRKHLFESLEKRELALPFVRSVQADIATKLAIPGKRYSVWIENDGGVSITAHQD